ncbi:hypothetical protein HIM_12482 [Hirsutella minnesotensis 3608]|uniref:Uncharacterized protein n=1 Tax=Hirsutella minnesotensis 3608 TaxID=1043627 RepID=A0A0F7ZW04_9HYPO|nr:hypothetical protein HIM_12482 [Hirsutella minnesotensis 3608]
MDEASVVFPSQGEPSVVVSLGTGSSQPSQGKSFLSRLVRAFWRLTDSKLRWKQMMSYRRLGTRTEFFRLDLDFQGAAPPLDDVERMEEVAEIAQTSISNSSAVNALAALLRAELFFFELDCTELPRYVNGAFVCVGHIVCRLQVGTAEFDEFQRQLRTSAASFWIGSREIPVGLGDEVDARSAHFRKSVHFRAAGRDDSFDILLSEGRGEPRRISGSPFTIARLLRQQHLDSFFGQSNHKKRKGRESLVSTRTKRRRTR